MGRVTMRRAPGPHRSTRYIMIEKSGGWTHYTHFHMLHTLGNQRVRWGHMYDGLGRVRGTCQDAYHNDIDWD